MTEDSEEDEVSVIPLGRGSAELLPKHKQLKEKLIPAGVRVGEGGIFFTNAMSVHCQHLNLSCLLNLPE